MRKYGSYSSYLNSLKNNEEEKQKIERDDRRIKNIGILATLAVSLLTLLLTQFPIRTDKAQQTTQEGIQSIANKLDSVLKATQHIQTTQQTKPLKDTATSK